MEAIMKWIKTTEATKLLGISRQTLYRMIKANKIRAYKLGRQYRFDEAEVLEWMRRQR